MNSIRASSDEPTSAPRRRAVPARATRDEVLALAERAARVSDGFALLERAPLECVAVLLGVDPRAVERVRVALEDHALRDEAARWCLECVGHRRPLPMAPSAPPAPSDPEQLLAAAHGRTGGLPLLLDAAPEVAAIAFGVHPELVHRAREAAARASVSDV